MINESDPFLSFSLKNAPLTQRWNTKSRICVWYGNRISNKMIPLSLNGSMNIYQWPWQREHFMRKITKLLRTMKMVIKKVPLLPKSAKKDTLFSDLLRSEPHSEKGTLFCEFLNKHVNTYRKCGPPGGWAMKMYIFISYSGSPPCTPSMSESDRGLRAWEMLVSETYSRHRRFHAIYVRVHFGQKRVCKVDYFCNIFN